MLGAMPPACARSLRPLALAAAVLAALVSSCGGAEAEAGPPPSEADALRARAATRFEHADLFKPKMGEEAGLDPYLAPLFYLEAPPEGVAGDASLGSLRVDGDGRLDVDPDAPAVYWADDLVRIRDREHRQTTFVWFRSVEASGATAQGVRVTFDTGGMPAVFEALTDGSELTPLYVTKSHETAALDTFGAALEGRRFAVEAEESGGEGDARFAVVEIVDDGPVPMGPYVYHSAGRADVAALHCRCSPTRADEIREMREYELVPLDLLEGAWSAEDAFGAPDRAVGALRLPAGF
jgi:hypothetical protein